MSILITGLEMPTERESFNLTIKYNGTVLDTATGMQVAEAHELPPHGRMIDADKVLDGLTHNIGICSLDYLTPNEWAIVSWFRDAPTIIPASEEAEENMRIQRRCSG